MCGVVWGLQVWFRAAVDCSLAVVELQNARWSTLQHPTMQLSGHSVSAAGVVTPSAVLDDVCNRFYLKLTVRHLPHLTPPIPERRAIGEV